MFDVGFSELLLLAIVALVVLGPEKLPHAARVAGAWVARIRRTISTMQTEIEREVAADEVRQAMEKQFAAMGGQDFMRGLQEERSAIEGSLQEAQQSLQDSPTGAPVDPALSLDAGFTPAEQPIVPPVLTPQPDAPAAVTGASPAPVLPDAATPPDAVHLDGEQAYRDWLQAQRRDHRIAPDALAAAPKDPSA